MKEWRDKVAVVLGTRPEAVKRRGVIRLLDDHAVVVHTGQHYSDNLAASFLEEIGLSGPDLGFDIGGMTRAAQIGTATVKLAGCLEQRSPAALMVHGDTNSSLAGVLAANAVGVPLAHVEAGLRSYDRAMPEEPNRVLVDHLSDLCCAPTETSRRNLKAEGIAGQRVVVTGNTVVDAALEFAPRGDEQTTTLNDLELVANGYVLATFHRPENVDDMTTLRIVLDQLRRLPLPVLLPLHPRTKRRLDDAGASRLLDSLVVERPAGYQRFLTLMAGAALVVPDSGGVQEEASVLKRPVIVVRNSTERPEVIGTFSTLVNPGPEIGSEAARVLENIDGHLDHLSHIVCPYGDGHASEHTVAAIRHLVAS